MIEEIRIEGFRLLRNFEWRPEAGVNILVGANSAGKSTVLDAIELVTRGSLANVRASNALAPDWFNADAVRVSGRSACLKPTGPFLTSCRFQASCRRLLIGYLLYLDTS